MSIRMRPGRAPSTVSPRLRAVDRRDLLPYSTRAVPWGSKSEAGVRLPGWLAALHHRWGALGQQVGGVGGVGRRAPANIMGRVSERDDGIAVHYLTVSRGTPIYAADGEQVGNVVRVLDNHREHILDGIVFEDSGGTVRFVDGPEVQRTFERAVELNISAGAARELGPPPATGVAGAVKNSKLGRLLGR